MDQDTKVLISKIQQAIWKLKQAKTLLLEIDGMDFHCDSLTQQIDFLEKEMDELYSIG